MRFVTMILVASISTLGCVHFGSMKIEKVPKNERALRMAEAPPINLVFRPLSGLGAEEIRWGFENVRDSFPFLDNAAVHNEEAAYTLTLLTKHAGESCWPGNVDCVATAGYSLWVIPAYESQTWRYEATWSDRPDEVLYRHEGEMKQVEFWQFFLVWALPVNAVTMATAPGPKKMVRRLLALIERDLVKYGLGP